VFALKVTHFVLYFLAVTPSIEQVLDTISELQSTVNDAQSTLSHITTVIMDIISKQQEVVTTQEEVVEEDVIKLDTKLVSLISEVTEQRIDRMTVEYRDRIKDIEKVNVAFEVVLSDYFSDEEINLIVDKLNFCRRMNDFSYMSPVYAIYRDNIAFREVLKAICAMYRLNVKNYVDDSTQSARYQDRSIVKYATTCPECGETAAAIVNNLLSAGLTK
jgi:hypothetical protein